MISNLLGKSITIFKNYDTTRYILFLNDFYHGRSRYGRIRFSNWRSNRISSSYICTKRQRPPRRTRRLKLKPKKNFLFLFIIFLFYNISKISYCPKSLYLHRKSLSSFPSLSLYNIFQNIGILYNQ